MNQTNELRTCHLMLIMRYTQSPLVGKVLIPLKPLKSEKERVLFNPQAPSYPNEQCFRKLPRLRPLVLLASPACPSDDSNIKIKMSMERWWNDTDRGKLKHCDRFTVTETCHSATLPTKNSHGLTPGSSPGLCAVRGRRMTA
jgi:hypothetical protein